ncbi:cytochrome P450 4p1 [Drosophila erecta]|uniref:cytochrome P450 4p1 n=1 Tax=Drosophila erecta TaxID=7220 RepID=UPI000177F720|nr:cytochrome P450 4p1 [Drosophila erecta]
MIVVWLVLALSALLHWLYRVNKDYHVLSLFAKRIRSKDGTPMELIAPTPKGKSIFGNTFDLYGRDHAGVFNHSRERAAQMGTSYIEYSFGTAIYNIIDAETAENVMNHPNLITKGLVYNFLHPFLRTGLLTSTGKKWHARRKMLTPTFHFNILNQFQEIFKTESQKFLQQFEGQDDITVCLHDVIPRFTLNSICETAMGVKLDEMAEKGDRYRENFGQIEECFIRRLSNPLFWGDKLFNIFAAKDYAAALDVVHGFSSEIIAKRRVLLKDELDKSPSTQTADDDGFVSKKRFAMLDTLIHAEKDGLIDHIGICEEVDTLMFEGYDTTSIGLIFGLMNMSLYPDKQELCFQEIQEHIDDDLGNLDVSQLNKLKYLEYFMKETMRLFPSVPIMGREAVQETELANGLILPKGAQITLHVFDIHRNTKYWDSPEEFRPERFLPENVLDRHTYAYVPFSAGQRNCIGQKYAMQEMKTLMVVLLKQFRVVKAINPQKIVFHMGITLRTRNKIRVKLVRRK